MGLINEIARALDLYSTPVRNIQTVPVHSHHRPSAGGVQVRRTTAPLWQERHWSRNSNKYRGFYRTRYGSWEGRIEEPYTGHIRFFIKNPPSCLQRHSHAQCFLPRNGGEYEIHFSRSAKTASDGIVQIERILAEAHQI